MESEHDCCKSKNKEGAGIKNFVLIGIVIAVLLISVVQSFQIKSIKSKIAQIQITGNAANSNGVMDMSGWTDDEKMMYEHHGVLPSRLGQNQKQTSQVGSC